VLLADGLPQLLEAGVLRGEAALGGCVDDQDDLALVVGEGDLSAGFCGCVSGVTTGNGMRGMGMVGYALSRGLKS
jgi:hypothetical protein